MSPALKTAEDKSVYTSVSDPGRRGSEAATAPKDWTIRRPEPEKVEDPPPKPLYQVLMEHVQKLWTVSASAVQLDQVHNQLTVPTPAAPSEAPGDFAKSVLVYDPDTIKKNERL